MAGQTVHRRLKPLNIIQTDKFTDKEIQRVKEFYGSNNLEPKNLNILVEELKRPKTGICRLAKKLGLTSLRRKKSEEVKREISVRTKNYIKKYGHPRGMLGKKHSLEHLKKQSIRTIKWWKEASDERKRKVKEKQLRNNLNKYGHVVARPFERTKVSWKQGWRQIGNRRIYCRSRWEANYARYLQFLKESGIIKDWEHEATTFWFEKEIEGSLCYVPDFKVIYVNGMHEWHEVKGWYDERSIKKINNFRKYYSEEKLIIIDKNWFKDNTDRCLTIINGWEI